MIEVKINIVPYGNRFYEENIYTIQICNDGTGTIDYGNYKYEILGGIVTPKGKVKHHKRADGVLELLRLVLNDKKK